MKAVIEDKHVLAVIEIENLLDTLKTSNDLLDLIQKVPFSLFSFLLFLTKDSKLFASLN